MNKRHYEHTLPNIRGSLSNTYQYIFSLGYIFSNFDLYSGGRNFVVEGKRLSMPRIRFMHSFFLSIGYRF